MGVPLSKKYVCGTTVSHWTPGYIKWYMEKPKYKLIQKSYINIKFLYEIV